ncbi:hypothetical protein C8233_17980 [Halomonas sp. SF2003]|nr:hypothetical protein C8233_17980 [Halomonas sp. SF2003]
MLPAGSVAALGTVFQRRVESDFKVAVIAHFDASDDIAVAVGNVDDCTRLTGTGEGRAIGLFEYRRFWRSGVFDAASGEVIRVVAVISDG